MPSFLEQEGMQIFHVNIISPGDSCGHLKASGPDSNYAKI